MRQLVYEVCCIRYQVLFYLWRFGTVLNFQKSVKILRPGLSENFAFTHTLPMMIQLFGKGTHFGSKMSVL